MADVANLNVKDSRRDFIFGVLYLVGFVLFVEIVLIPIWALLGGGGAEESVNLTKFFLYVAWGVAVILFLVLFKAIRLFSKRGKDVYDVFVHDPEKSLLARLKDVPFLRFFYRVDKSILLLVLFSLLLFIPFSFVGGLLRQTAFEGSFLVNIFPQTAYSGSVLLTEQQVTETADFGLSVWPASPVETLTDVGVIALMLIFLRVLVAKGVIPVVVAGFFKWTVVPVLGALNHLVIHLFRYGGSDVSLLGVFNFGLLTAYLFLIFASVIIVSLMHEINNGVGKLFEMGILGSDASIGVVMVIWATILAIFVIVYNKKLKKLKASREAVGDGL